MAFPPVPFQEWFLRQTSTGNAALNAYVARVKADGGVVEAIGCVPLAVWDWVAPVAPTLLLDLFPNAAAAYSLRKLRAAYSGSAVRVRRSSDNTEQDIGFDANGDLDSTALLAFVNADVNQYTSDFSSTEDLNESNGTGAAAQSVGGVGDAYKFTLSGGAVSHFPRVLGALNTSDTFNISFDFYIPSSNSSCDGIQLYLLAGSPLYNTLDAWTSVSLTNVTSTSAQLRFYPTDGGSLTVDGDGDVFYLKNIVITQTSADGLVTTWYDQTQNDPLNQNNATQGTAANQPKIVSGGSLVTENGKAAIDFDGVNDYFAFTKPTTLSGEFFITTALNCDPVGIASTLLNNQTGFNDRVRLLSTGIIQARISGSLYSYISSFTPNTQSLLTIQRDSVDSIEIYVNSSSKGANTDGNDWTEILGYLGSNQSQSASLFYNGNIQEFIAYNLDESANRTAIETNINNFYSIY